MAELNQTLPIQRHIERLEQVEETIETEQPITEAELQSQFPEVNCIRDDTDVLKEKGKIRTVERGGLNFRRRKRYFVSTKS